MGVKVKICGITNLKDALFAVKAGSNALGFIFYKKSPRYLSPVKAKAIIRQLPSSVKKVGVFVNAKEATIRKIAKECNLDLLQFHGEESSAFCDKFKGYRIIKVFRIKDKLDLKEIQGYKTFAYLFDTFSPLGQGGTGKRFNWDLIKHFKDLKRPIFLSGGLTKQNIKKAIRTVHPDWVDVSSSVELEPGKKDSIKIREFISVVKK
ncbi:MAG: phosphoribosylanthranilate isomerase [Candidatus Omnitrophica bacterium]|nr:phosphoribosylanthranilate isomerase [Candidatus Omnitrophota bacterium]